MEWALLNNSHWYGVTHQNSNTYDSTPGKIFSELVSTDLEKLVTRNSKSIQMKNILKVFFSSKIILCKLYKLSLQSIKNAKRIYLTISLKTCVVSMSSQATRKSEICALDALLLAKTIAHHVLSNWQYLYIQKMKSPLLDWIVLSDMVSCVHKINTHGGVIAYSRCCHPKTGLELIFFYQPVLNK